MGIKTESEFWESSTPRPHGAGGFPFVRSKDTPTMVNSPVPNFARKTVQTIKFNRIQTLISRGNFIGAREERCMPRQDNSVSMFRNKTHQAFSRLQDRTTIGWVGRQRNGTVPDQKEKRPHAWRKTDRSDQNGGWGLSSNWGRRRARDGRTHK